MKGLRGMLGKRSSSDMGELVYAYAKACGIIGKSFVGKRIKKLDALSRLSELDRMLFPASGQDLPEKELLVDLEKRIIGRSINSIITIINCFSKAPGFLIFLLRRYEYEDIKKALDVNIEGTDFAFLPEDESFLNQEQGDSIPPMHLDQHYYNSLWESLSRLPGKDRYAAGKILSEEISLKNSCWALRLRTYYNMKADEIKSYLIDLPVAPKRKKRSLAEEAVQCLDFPLDDFDAWSSWRWKKFLNSPAGKDKWQADPRHFQNASSRYLFQLAYRLFRINPFSLDSVFCFIKLKQFEEDLLVSYAEALGMGFSGREIISLLGAAS